MNVHSNLHQLFTTPIFHLGHVMERKEAHWSLIAHADSFLGKAPQESRNQECSLKLALTKLQTQFSPDYSSGQNGSGESGTNHCVCINRRFNGVKPLIPFSISHGVFHKQGGWFSSLLSSGSAARACFQSCCSHIQKVPQHSCGPGFGHCPILLIRWLTWTFMGSAGESHLCIQAHANCLLNDKEVIPVNKDTHRHVSFYNPMYPADHNHTCFSIRKIVVVIDSSSFTLFLFSLVKSTFLLC